MKKTTTTKARRTVRIRTGLKAGILPVAMNKGFRVEIDGVDA